MADNVKNDQNQKPVENKTDQQKNDEKTNVGTADPTAFASADVQAAEEAGLSEGDIKALRDEAGVNQLAGHQANIHAWTASVQGQEFLDGEGDRVKAEEDVAKEREKATNDEGLTEAEAKYAEVVNKK